MVKGILYFLLINLVFQEMDDEMQVQNQKNANLTVQELMEKISRYSGNSYSLPLEAAQGYPVPVIKNDILMLAVPFFTKKGLPPAHPAIYSPEWIVFIDVASGENIKTEQNDLPLADPIGTYHLDLTMKEYKQKVKELYNLMDKLMFELDDYSRPINREIISNADKFKDIWRQLVNESLMPYYKEINPAWFEYLGF